MKVGSSSSVDNLYEGFGRQAVDYNNTRKLNIAMFTNNYSPYIGGVPISINRLAKGLREKGHNVYIFAPDYPEAEQENTPYIVRCKLLGYYKRKQFNYAVVNIFSPEIRKEFALLNIDVIHVHHPFWMGSLGLILGKRNRIPVIFTFHTRLDKYAHFVPCFRKIFEKYYSHHIIQHFSHKCNAVFAPTDSAKEYLEMIGVRRYKTVLTTGIDFSNSENADTKEISKIRNTYADKNEFLLCTVSRLSKEKNIFFILEGIEKLKGKTPVSFKYILIGDGPEKNNILNSIKRKGLEDTVFLLGSIPPESMGKYYSASDIFVFASQSETQGIVLLEAMAGSCPVVAIRSSGIDDIIREEYNGFKTTESADLWSDKILLLMENPELLKQMSKNAYTFCKDFSIEKMAEKAEKEYLRVISSLNHRKAGEDIHYQSMRKTLRKVKEF